jgi:hypothetical protein
MKIEIYLFQEKILFSSILTATPGRPGRPGSPRGPGMIPPIPNDSPGSPYLIFS